eukprot:3660141-Pyramimonas_sp.AAC.2
MPCRDRLAGANSLARRPRQWPQGHLPRRADGEASPGLCLGMAYLGSPWGPLGCHWRNVGPLLKLSDGPHGPRAELDIHSLDALRNGPSGH